MITPLIIISGQDMYRGRGHGAREGMSTGGEMRGEELTQQ